MPKRAETTKEIFRQNQNKTPSFFKLIKNKSLLAGRWGLLFSVIFSIIAGGLAGYLVSSYWFNTQQPNSTKTNVNSNIIDFTKKITITDSNTALINKLSKQIVAIYAVKSANNWWQKLYLDNEFLGTGIVITSDGWIMTTSEVIDNPKRNYQIMTADNNYLAKNFIQDELTGVVFLKIDAQNLTPVQFADLEQLPLAQEVLVITADNNLNDVKVKISNLEKIDYFFQKSIKDYFHSTEKQDEYFLLKDLLPANSNGSLIANSQGEVIGLGQNVNQEDFFQTIIPASYLSQAVKNFLINKTEVKRSYLGLTYLDLSQTPNLAANLTADKKQGALIMSSKDLNIIAIKKDSPAKNILEEGDIILQVNGEEIDERNNFTELIQDYSSGNKIKLLIFRNGEEKEVEITLK